MAFKDQINQNVGFFIYNREFLFFSGIIGSPQAFNRFQIIPGSKDFWQTIFFTLIISDALVKNSKYYNFCAKTFLNLTTDA